MFFFKDIGSDTVNISLPRIMQKNHLWKDGQFFTFWSFYDGLGKAQPVNVSLFPVYWLNNLFLSLFGVSYNFYRIYPLLFFFVLPSGIFAYLYFRTLNFSKYTSIIGGLLFEFSGYMIVGMQWSHASELLFFIFLLFAFEQFLLKKRWFYLPVAFYLLSLNPYFLATTSIFFLFYSSLRFYDKNESFRGYVVFMFKIAGLGLVGIIANAPAFYSTLSNMINSPRVTGDATLTKQLMDNPENINSYLRNATLILRTFSNDLLGTGSNFRGWYNYLEAPLFYIGLLSLILLPFSFAYIEKKKRLAYAVFGGFWLLVAFVPILRHAVNFFVGNYYKITIDVFVPFTMLFFAMIALENILKKEKLNELLLVISVGLLLILLYFPYFKNNLTVVDFKMQIVLSIFIIAEAVLIYFISKNKEKNLLKILLLTVVVLELSYVAYPSVNNRKVFKRTEIVYSLAGYNDGTIDAVNYIKQLDTSKFYRIEKDYSSVISEHTSLNDAMVQGYFGTTCYSSFNQLNYIKFLEGMNIIKKGNEGQTRWCVGVRGVPILMSFAGVKYFLTHNPENELRYDGYDSIAKVKDIIILKNNYALPLGFACHNYLKKSDFDKLTAFKKQEALLNAVVLDDETTNLIEFDTSVLVPIDKFNFDLYKSFIDSLRKYPFVIDKFSHMRITGTVTTDKPACVFFSIPYDEGWRVKIDGKNAELKKVNIGFCGVFLDEGKHTIELYYRPPYFYLTVIIAIVGILIYLSLFYFLKKIKSSTTDENK